MDWPRARAILLVAFTLINGLLAYAVWGPSVTGNTAVGRGNPGHIQTVRARLGELGLDLAVAIPQSPSLMPQFLRVEYDTTPEALLPGNESIGRPVVGQPGGGGLQAERATGVRLLDLQAQGTAAREVRLDNKQAVRQAAEDYLRVEGLYRPDSRFTRTYPAGDGLVGVEYIQVFQGVPVFSGYCRVVISRFGVETVEERWARPLSFRGEQKAVLAPTEALLRVAGHVGGTSGRTFTEIELGYYAGRPLGGAEGSAYAEDVVPVWRIALDTGDLFYINAFTGELE